MLYYKLMPSNDTHDSSFNLCLIILHLLS